MRLIVYLIISINVNGHVKLCIKIRFTNNAYIFHNVIILYVLMKNLW